MPFWTSYVSPRDTIPLARPAAGMNHAADFHCRSAKARLIQCSSCTIPLPTRQPAAPQMLKGWKRRYGIRATPATNTAKVRMIGTNHRAQMAMLHLLKPAARAGDRFYVAERL